MHFFELWLNVITLFLDYILIVGAAVTAYFLRFHTTFLTDARPVQYVIPLRDYVVWAFLYGVLMIAIFAILRLYAPGRRKFMDELFTIIAATSWGILGGVFLMFFARQFIASRFILVALWVFTILYVVMGRVMLRWMRALLHKTGYGMEHIVLLGHGLPVERIQHLIMGRPSLGYRVALVVPAISEQSLEALRELHARTPLDRVVVVTGDTSRGALSTLLEWCDQHHVVLEYSADRFGASTPRLTQETWFGMPLVRVIRTPLTGWGSIAKRIFDVIGSLCLLVLLSPLLLVIALAIKLDSRGPVLFTRRDEGSPLLRIGQFGKPFRYVKFRSMIEKCDSLRYTKLALHNTRKGPLVKIKNDPRVTRVGRFLRRFSLDELPELLLVLKGDMSLVGPRPHLPEEVARYKQEYKRLFLIKPGMTGISQVSGRSDLDFEDEVSLDIFYIENWSLRLDIMILLKTPLVVLKGVEG